MWDIAESGNSLAARANALRAQVRNAFERGLTYREEVELTALAFSLQRLLDDLDPNGVTQDWRG